MEIENLQGKAYSRVLDRLITYADLVGRIEGQLDANAGNYLSDFDTLMHIRELIAHHKAETENATASL